MTHRYCASARAEIARLFHCVLDRDEEIARLRRLLAWVYREHGGEGWARVCDEEIEIEEIAKREEVDR